MFEEKNNNGSFERFRSLVPLYGTDYETPIKATWYNILAGALLGVIDNRSPLANPIYIWRSYEDTRIPVFFFMPSASGKDELIDIIRRSCFEGVKYEEIAALFPEQLIGTIVRDERHKTGPKAVPGLMDDDHLVLDEAYEWLTGKDHYSVQIRKNIKLGLDTFGKNPITKRLTGLTYNERLWYYARCSLAIFSQPLPIPADFLTAGLGRRGLIVYLRISVARRLESYDQSFKQKPSDEDELWTSWLNTLHTMRRASRCLKWKVVDEARIAINQYPRQLVLESGLDQSPKIRNFARIMLFPLRSFLAKMACIRAADRQIEILDAIDDEVASLGFKTDLEVTLQDVQNAFGDLKSFWAGTLAFVRDQIEGDLAYDPYDDVDRAIIGTLCNKHTFSVETGAPIKQLLQIVAKQASVSEKTVEYHYLKLKRNGVVRRKQIGQHGSSVWLSDPSTCDYEEDERPADQDTSSEENTLQDSAT